VTVTLAMPRLADTMEEGTILEWTKAVGDHVARGETICEIEMEKAAVTYESHVAGRLTRIIVEAGGSASVGAPIAELEPDA